MDAYAEYEGFKYFNANYEYEMMWTVLQGDKLVNETANLGLGPDPNIPKYLQAMYEQITGFKRKIKISFDAVKDSSSLSKVSLKKYEKIFMRGIFLLASYPTTIENGTYALRGNFKKLFEILEEKDYHPE